MKKLYILGAMALGAAAVSCDDYLDINTDPNTPSADVVTSDMIMPAVEMNLAATYGDFMRITGGYFAQHYAQQFGTSNYVDYSAFYMSATRSSGAYTQLMQRVISNSNTIIEKSEAAGQWGSYLAATCMRVFAYETLVDCYGEMPYSEAFTSTTSPKFDEGADIYVGIIGELDNALAKVSGSDLVCTNFLYPGQKAAAWIKFANALKLRLLTRAVDQIPALQSNLDALVAENNFITSDVQWANCWAQGSGQESPFYSEETSSNFGSNQINVIANIALIGTMQQAGFNDPRLGAWFHDIDGEFHGYISSNTQIIQGTTDANGNACDASYFSLPITSYDMPVVILTVADVDFYLAEYYAKKNNAAKAAECYAAAVAASFASSGVSGADGYCAAFPYDQANWKKCVGIAKWVANAGFNGFEAWCEMRRLDYPALSDQKGEDFDNGVAKSLNPSSYIPGTIYTPRAVRSEIGAKHLIERWPYPESSTSRNSNAPKFPGHTTPVFWGK